MISRLTTAFGGTAGFIAFTFFILLTVFHLQQNYHLVPIRDFISDSEPAGGQKEIAAIPRTVAPQMTMPVAPQITLPGSTSIKPSDLLPKPEEYANDISVLKGRQLIFPLQGVPRNSMRNSYRETRGMGRQHEGVDILAPRNTPVLAIEDGKIGRLWNSEAGGITVYQLDPTNTYVYYYAHLEKYAPNLEEGQTVRKGQIIGYVGTSGNAPPNTPHLHFAIYKATQPGRWWNGMPIDPYPVYP